MNREKITRIITAFAAAVSIFNYGAISANATWIQDSNNKWNWVENNKKAVGWKLISGKWYFFYSNGTMATGWVKDGQVWYYFDNSGAMKTGWAKVGEDWYYFDKSGSMKTGWIYSSGSWYYLKSDGAMATGWITDKNNKYYLKSSGEMAVGKLTISGVIYNFDSSGALITNEINTNKPSNDKEEERKAYVVTKSDPLNLRENDSIDSKVLGRIPKGTEIIVVSKEINGFYKVLWNKLEGYVSSQWISFDKPEVEEEIKEEDEKEDNDDTSDVIVRDYAPSTDNMYYYSNGNIFYSAKLSPPFLNSNGKPIVGNCTWYAWGRIWEMTKKKPIDAGFNGNAYEWWNANIKSGKYQYGTTPKVGALAVWKSSLANSGGCGHVAIVEKIENGKVYISESAWHGALFKYKEIYNINDLYGYIYVNKPNY